MNTQQMEIVDSPQVISIPNVTAPDIPVSAFLQRAQELKTLKSDVVGNTGGFMALAVTENGQTTLRMSIEDTVYTMNRHAALQLADRLCVAHHNKSMPREYWDAMEPGEQGHTLDYLQKKFNSKNDGGKGLTWRIFDGTVRACVSDAYTFIDTFPMVERVLMNLQGQNLPQARVVGRSFITPDACQLTVMFHEVKQVNGSDWGVGVRFSTDEIGQRAFSVEGVVQRSLCNNSIVFRPEVSRVTVAHRGRNATHIAWAVMEETITACLEQSGMALRKMIDAERAPLNVPDYGAFLGKVLGDLGLTEAEKTNALIGTEGAQTVGGIINGVTAAAKFCGAERSAQLEAVAGDLLFSNKIQVQAARA